jgi:hypothetical protein
MLWRAVLQGCVLVLLHHAANTTCTSRAVDCVGTTHMLMTMLLLVVCLQPLRAAAGDQEEGKRQHHSQHC